MSVFLQIPLMQLFLPNKRKKNITITSSLSKTEEIEGSERTWRKHTRGNQKCNILQEFEKEVEQILLKWIHNLFLEIYCHALPSKFHSFQVTKLHVLMCCRNKPITKATKHNTVFAILCLLNLSICLKKNHIYQPIMRPVF